MKDKVKYLVIIDTSSYAGSFNRDMCAYITGQLGDCGVGRDQRDVFLDEEGVEKDEWFAEHIEHTTDDHGCWRPVALSSTPGWFNDGAGHFYREDSYDPVEVLNNYNAYAERNNHPMRASSSNDIRKYDAFLSFEIMFLEELPDDMFDLIVRRAHKYAEENWPGYNPADISVRLVKRITQDQEIKRA